MIFAYDCVNVICATVGLVGINIVTVGEIASADCKLHPCVTGDDAELNRYPDDVNA